MKRLIIVTAVIALVAVAVFGGQALAAKPTKPTGSLVAIETDEDSISVSNDLIWTNVSYPEVRHVSITLNIVGLQSPDFVSLWTWMPDGWGPRIAHLTVDGFYTYEFDSGDFLIKANDEVGTPIYFSYYVTTTYPR